MFLPERDGGILLADRSAAVTPWSCLGSKETGFLSSAQVTRPSQNATALSITSFLFDCDFVNGVSTSQKPGPSPRYTLDIEDNVSWRINLP